MKPLWTGAIGFGLVNIPVKVFSAVQDSSLDLDLLDGRDHSNIKYKKVNENTGKEVPYNDIVRAYLYNDKYVELDKADFEAADAKKTKMIEILNFVDEKEIDPIYYEQPYYLEPDKYGDKAYALLRAALTASAKAGVATFVMRNKESLVTLSPRGPVIILNRLRFEEEIRSEGELKLPPISKSKTKELDVAINLIDQLTVKFNISKYKDTFSATLMKIIKQKAKTGKRPVAPKLKVAYKKPQEDLMSVLKASLNGKRKAS